MLDQNISIHFTVSINSVPYVNFAIANYYNLSSKKNSLEFNLYCLDVYTFRKFKRSQFRVIFVENASGSIGHAKAAEQALHSFKHNAVNIVSDSDVALVCPNWDQILLDEFSTSKKALIGTQYEPFNGFSTGDSKTQTYKGKPTITWLAFNRGITPTGLSLMPMKEKTLQIQSKSESETYGLPIGFELLRDTGWQIPGYIADNKLNFSLLEIVKPFSQDSIVLKGLSPYHDEFHLNRKPFLVHQRGSMSHQFNKDPLSRDFYSALLSYFNEAEWAKSASKRSFIGETRIKLYRLYDRFVRMLKTVFTKKLI